MIIIFNPTRSKGYAIDSQSDQRFVSLRWNAEDSELVTKEHIKNMEDEYGRESNSFRIGVLGLPPKVDEDTLIPWEWIEDAIIRDIEPLEEDAVVKALDPGAGGDMSIIATRKGYKFYKNKRKKTPDSEILCNWAGADIDAENPDVFRVDMIGIGWAVYGTLSAKKGIVHNEKGTSIEGFDSRGTANDSDMFFNRRAEAYWNLRQRFEKGLVDLPADTERTVKMQLGAIKYEFDGKNRVKIIDKKKIKTELGHSPDDADAMAMTVAVEDDLVTKISRNRRPYYQNLLHKSHSKNAWMGA